MNVKTISVNYERKLNLGNYESAALGVTIWFDLEPGEDEGEATRAAFAMAKANVKAQAAPLLAKDAQARQLANESLKNYVAGLQVVDHADEGVH